MQAHAKPQSVTRKCDSDDLAIFVYHFSGSPFRKTAGAAGKNRVGARSGRKFWSLPTRSRRRAVRKEDARMLKRTGKIRGIYLRGEVYWFAKQVNGRRSRITLETRDYAESVQRAQEILNRPELQPPAR